MSATVFGLLAMSGQGAAAAEGADLVCLDATLGAAADEAMVAAVQGVVEQRLAQMGLPAYGVVVDAGYLTIEIPAEADSFAVRSLIVAPGRVEVVPVPDGMYLDIDPGAPLPGEVAGVEAMFDDHGIADVVIDFDEVVGEPVLDVRLTPEAAGILDDYAAAHLGGQIVIAIDGLVVSAPTLNAGDFDGQLRIMGGPLATAQVAWLSAVLGARPLPAPLELVAARFCDPATPGPGTTG